MDKHFKSSEIEDVIINNQEIEDINGIGKSMDISDIQEFTPAPKKKYYRFNLKMPLEYEAYLKTQAFNESTPDNIVTVTEYICSLIASDMKKKGGN